MGFAEFSDRKGKKSLSFRSVQPFQLIHSNRGLVADWLLSDLMEQASPTGTVISTHTFT